MNGLVTKSYDNRCDKIVQLVFVNFRLEAVDLADIV